MFLFFLSSDYSLAIENVITQRKLLVRHEEQRSLKTPSRIERKDKELDNSIGEHRYRLSPMETMIIRTSDQSTVNTLSLNE